MAAELKLEASPPPPGHSLNKLSYRFGGSCPVRIINLVRSFPNII